MLLQSVLWIESCMDSLFSDFQDKLRDFYLNFLAKTLAGFTFREYCDYFRNNSNLSDLSLQGMQKLLAVLLSKS